MIFSGKKSTSSNDSRKSCKMSVLVVCVGGDKRQRYLFKCAYTSAHGCTDPWVHKHTGQLVARGWHGVSYITLFLCFETSSLTELVAQQAIRGWSVHH